MGNEIYRNRLENGKPFHTGKRHPLAGHAPVGATTGRAVHVSGRQPIFRRRGGYQPPECPGSIRRDGGFWRRAVREAGPYGGVR